MKGCEYDRMAMCEQLTKGFWKALNQVVAESWEGYENERSKGGLNTTFWKSAVGVANSVLMGRELNDAIDHCKRLTV